MFRMSRPARRSHGSRGQVLVLFVLSLVSMVLMVGVVIDGGYGLAQRRAAQNASDFAALSGARVVAEWIAGNTVDGRDANVRAAISASIHANGGAPLTFGSPNGPQYVGSNGNATGWVGSGVIPAGTVGVTLNTERTWRPFFLSIAGINSWSASATATARGGYASGPPSGGVFPAGIAENFFVGRSTCSGPVSSDPSSPCYVQHLTPGVLNVPGGFGWLKFGCPGYGLGQNSDGCGNSAGFLNGEIAGNTYGCCTQVKLPGSADKIGSFPGNKAEAECSSVYGKLVSIAVWDYADGTGSNAYYHIIGFTGFQVTGCPGAKNLDGVWRQPMTLGPTTTTPGFAGEGLGVELVH